MSKRSARASAEAGKRPTRPTDQRYDRTYERSVESILPTGPIGIRMEDLPAGAKALGDGMYELPDGMLVYLDESE